MRTTNLGRPGRLAAAWFLALSLAGATTVGCGLLDLQSFNGFTFNLPEKTYNIDTEDSRWDSPPANGFPNVSCGAGGVLADCCTAPVGSPFTVDCQKYPLACEASSCTYKLTYEVGSVVDLKKEVAQLNSTTSASLKKITLKNIKLTLTNNLNMAMPPVDVFVAPMDATTAADPRARKLATLPGHEAGYNGSETVPVDAAGQAAFSMFAQNYNVPFKILARAIITLKAGQPAPTGKAIARIGGQAEAEL